MKKIVLIILVIALCVVLFDCNSAPSNWTSITINCGTIKVPENWSVSYYEDLMYFYDKNADGKENICMFQSNSYSEFKSSVCYSVGLVEANAFSSKFQSLYTISAGGTSNGALYGEAMTSVDGIECKMRFLEFSYNENDILFYVNTDVSDEIFEKIAKSFS